MTDDLIHGDWERISRHQQKLKISSNRDARRLRCAKTHEALIARLVARIGLRLVGAAIIHGS
jgi:hypothetical protein